MSLGWEGALTLGLWELMAFSGGTTLGASGSSQMPGKEKPIAYISTENYALFIGSQGLKAPRGSFNILQNPMWCVWAHSVFLGSTLSPHVGTLLKTLPKVAALFSAWAASI